VVRSDYDDHLIAKAVDVDVDVDATSIATMAVVTTSQHLIQTQLRACNLLGVFMI